MRCMDTELPPAQKKKAKARSVWISFLGRIVAQVVGAVATVILAVTFLQSRNNDAPVKDVAAPIRPAPARVAGRVGLVVLPLSNFSADDTDDYFADGMTEALTADLAQIDGLRVISRTSAMQYRATKQSLPQIADELGVEMVLEGSVSKSGDRIRVTAQLIEAASDTHVWARNYDRTMRDVLTLQGELAAEIARELKTALTPKQQHQLSARKAVDPAVYELYLRGRFAWSRRTPEDSAAAIEYFTAAIAKDPTFAAAYAGIADAYRAASPQLSIDGNEKARSAISRALELDDNLAEAHASLGGLLHQVDGNMVDAEREFKKAIELNPGYPTAHQWYAVMLTELHRNAEALSHANLAVGADPLTGVMHQSQGLVHFAAGRYDQSLSSYRRALALAPSLVPPQEFIPRALLAKGEAAGALAYLKQRAAAPSPESRVTTAMALASLGDQAAAQRSIEPLLAMKPRPANALARWYASSNDKGRALDLLDQVVKSGRNFHQATIDPVFNGIRSEPRYAALERDALARRR